MDKAAVSHGSAHDPFGASFRVHALWWTGCPVSLYSIQVVSQTKYDTAQPAAPHFKTCNLLITLCQQKLLRPSPPLNKMSILLSRQ